ncbi:hypothetical protein WMF30_10580 [Sorangium sp. So ce134]
MTAAFRIAAHQHFAHRACRGRLLLQLAYVADAEARAIWDPYAWPPVRWCDLSDEQRAEHDRLCAQGKDLAAEAARLGVRGGADEAFRDVYAAAAPLFEAGAEREHLVWEVARALEAGAILMAPRCSVGPLGEAVPSGRAAFACYVDPGGVMINNGRFSADVAAAAFCGERGAGEEAARAALEGWESREEERAA